MNDNGISIGSPGDEMGAGLLRQRRNLMLTSLALSLYYVAGGQFNGINFPAATLTFSRPQVVVATAWATWAYFYVRYLQYLLEEDRGIRAALEAHVAKLAARHLKAEQWLAEGVPLQVFHRGRFKGWALAASEYDARTGAVTDQHPGNFGYVRGAWWLARAIAVVGAKTRILTDYVFPCTVGLLPPIGWCIAQWVRH